MFLVLIQGSIMLFDGLLLGDSYTLDPYNASIHANTTNVVWNFMADPTGWGGTGLILIFIAAVGIAGGISVGVYLITKSDTVLLFPIFLTFLGFGAIPIISLYGVFNRNPTMWGCASIPCPISIFFWIITGGVLAIFYVLSCVEWWTGRATT